MTVAEGGGVGKDPSGGEIGEGGLLGGVSGRRLEEEAGEIGGEHLELHAGQISFDDNHWRAHK